MTGEANLMKCPQVFYGWKITIAAFLNLFFAVGIVYYGFPVFYPSLVESMGFTRAQATGGIFLGFVVVAPLSGLLAGVIIDRVGPRQTIRVGIAFVGLSLVFMGWMTSLWQYYLLCFTEVIGYVLSGPIPNQVLITNWFSAKRGRAMGYAYLGLGLGGTVAPLVIHWLIEWLDWRHAFQIIGWAILIILFPVAQWLTRSTPREMGLNPDGSKQAEFPLEGPTSQKGEVRRALRSRNFWLLLVGSTLTMFAIGTVIQHFILFLKDQGYSTGLSPWVLSGLLISSLAGRVIVGHFADRYQKKDVMAVFYLVLALSMPLLFLARHSAAMWSFALIFGFAMGADYMLIPLVTADCFGLRALGKLLAIIIMSDSLGQTFGPVIAGKIFDTYHCYDIAWVIVMFAGLVGAAAIYTISIAQVQRPTL